MPAVAGSLTRQSLVKQVREGEPLIIPRRAESAFAVPESWGGTVRLEGILPLCKGGLSVFLRDLESGSSGDFDEQTDQLVEQHLIAHTELSEGVVEPSLVFEATAVRRSERGPSRDGSSPRKTNDRGRGALWP